jgi:hypothetical protein
MSTSQILAFIAIAALLLAIVVGRNALKKDSGLRLAIGVFLFCSVAALTTAYFRQPWVVWPLGLSMLGAILFLIRAMHQQLSKRKLQAIGLSKHHLL